MGNYISEHISTPAGGGCWKHFPNGMGHERHNNWVGGFILSGFEDCDCLAQGTCQAYEPPLPPMTEFLNDPGLNPAINNNTGPSLPYPKMPDDHVHRQQWHGSVSGLGPDGRFSSPNSYKFRGKTYLDKGGEVDYANYLKDIEEAEKALQEAKEMAKAEADGAKDPRHELKDTEAEAPAAVDRANTAIDGAESPQDGINGIKKEAQVAADRAEPPLAGFNSPGPGPREVEEKWVSVKATDESPARVGRRRRPRPQTQPETEPDVLPAISPNFQMPCVGCGA
ncbi:hypothetical protein B0T10DRAFT_271771 [Thelonectria olida]|uniref:Uncharacterized protein n=1 Tax=Thelonectria olida TaxID=1576542 RepID=A0A9P8W9Q0_9HYPO|nr:hypothetical protein B0T10DRAFT_271771 [Thelonectria olida]